ncbi:probable sensor histidine kinase HK isoform X1 [Drosophila ficusphila]|uniref:probable sensor histidine kinase HK isoform X1 n=1 Tax=Drosophila ficusphila TaxID=30025 RepID=UPI0007E816F8|nr:probable sensor histidine kinase HK isoform X1 [Drosophila ficusphila]
MQAMLIPSCFYCTPGWSASKPNKCWQRQQRQRHGCVQHLPAGGGHPAAGGQVLDSDRRVRRGPLPAGAPRGGGRQGGPDHGHGPRHGQADGPAVRQAGRHHPLLGRERADEQPDRQGDPEKRRQGVRLRVQRHQAGGAHRAGPEGAQGARLRPRGGQQRRHHALPPPPRAHRVRDPPHVRHQRHLALLDNPVLPARHDRAERGQHRGTLLLRRTLRSDQPGALLRHQVRRPRLHGCPRGGAAPEESPEQHQADHHLPVHDRHGSVQEPPLPVPQALQADLPGGGRRLDHRGPAPGTGGGSDSPPLRRRGEDRSPDSPQGDATRERLPRHGSGHR